MPSFLKDYSKFYGTGDRNEEGKDLDQFLMDYNPGEYECPSVTTDVLVLWSERGFQDFDFYSPSQDIKILMIKRKDHPCIGQWALPGGFVNIREDLDDAVKRELLEETGLENVGVEQLFTWGEAGRDPRSRIITTAYLSVLEGEEPPIRAGDDAKDAKWFGISVHLEKEMTLSQGGKEKWKRYYKLELTVREETENEDNGEEGGSLSAVVLKTENVEGVLREASYEVLQSEGLAFDHARFVIQALDYLQSRIKMI